LACDAGGVVVSVAMAIVLDSRAAHPIAERLNQSRIMQKSAQQNRH
jgi:hypothetical protein